MSVELRKINMNNFRECINLSVDGQQKRFVATNIYSLAEAKADEVSIPLAIYAADKMVGFVMYDYEPKENQAYITRLMVDKDYQGNGYGRKTIIEVINRIESIDECKRIHISFVPQNTVAEKLYLSLGFIKTGEIDDGEIVCIRTIDRNI